MARHAGGPEYQGTHKADAQGNRDQSADRERSTHEGQHRLDGTGATQEHRTGDAYRPQVEDR